MNITDDVLDSSSIENRFPECIKANDQFIWALCNSKNLLVVQLDAVIRASELAENELYERWGRDYPNCDDEDDELLEARVAPLKEFVSSHPEIELKTLEALVNAHGLTVQSSKLFLAGNLGEAVFRIQCASYFIGIATAIVYGNVDALREFSRSGATAIHKENREAKRYALAYFRDNIEQFSSLDDAAEKIAGAVVPYTFRTVRDWLKGQESPSRKIKPQEPV